MIQKAFGIGILFLIMLNSSACQNEPTTGHILKGRIILWHGWPPENTLILEQAISDFMVLHPEVEVISVALAPEELFTHFYESAEEGLGPDIILTSSSFIEEYASMDFIRPIDTREFKKRGYPNRVVKSVSLEGIVYGIPAFYGPYALYYNNNMVDTLPTNLDELAEDLNQEQTFAFVPRFRPSYWGIQAFGQGLWDSQGNFTLAESGFREWLGFLAESQNQPTVILNVDDAALLDLFAEGGLTYYVAGPEKQATFKKTMGEDAFGVTTLPSGPQGSAGPLLPIESILLNAFSSNAGIDIANALAEFLTNQQQSIRFMRELDLVPANPTVLVDPRLYPTVAGFARQALTAVTLPVGLKQSRVFEAGDRAYASVLSGALTPDEAVCRFGLEVVAIQGYGPDQFSLPVGCTASTGQTPPG